MTKTIFRYLFAVLALSCVFTSCSDDDDDEPNFFEKSSTFVDGKGLALTYSGQPLVGKQVVFTPNGDKATLVISGLPFTQEISAEDTLSLPTVGLIPGEVTTTLTADMTIADNVATFSGKETKNNFTIEYTGTAMEGALALNVNVKMAANSLTNKTFKVNAVAFGAKPIHVTWLADEFDFSGGKWDMNSFFAMTFMMAKIDGKSIPQLLAGVLNEVSFLEDGNIQAKYKDEPADSLEWETSPLNLATYTVESDSKLRLFIHPNQIAAITKTAKASKAADLDGLLQSMLGMAAKFCVEGVELEYHITEDGGLSVYLTKETLLPILQQVKPLFQDKNFIDMILALLKENAGDMAAFIPLMEPVLVALPQTIDTTTQLDLGLDLDAAN